MNQEEMACPLTKGERILIALDGSKYGDAALDQAISLGRTCNSTIFAISVIELHPEQMEVAPALTEKMSEEAKETLDKAKAKVEKENICIKPTGLIYMIVYYANVNWRRS